MKKCKVDTNIKSVYLINSKDCIFDKDGNLIRLKRKYGKHDRTVQLIDY